MTGWLKLHRSIQSHWVWSFKEPDKTLAWIDLIAMAHFEDTTVMIKGQVIKVKRGQVQASQSFLKTRWGWSLNKVRRFLDLLKKEQMIEVQTDRLTTYITICNYSNFQGGDSADGSANDKTGESANGNSAEVQTKDNLRSKELKNSRSEESNKTLMPAKADIPPTGPKVCGDVIDVFEHWKQVMGKSEAAKLTKKRKGNVQARFKEGYTVDQIKQAIDGCAVTPHNMGQNEQGKRFDDLELICRSGENVERFAGNLYQQQSPMTGLSRITQQNLRNIEGEW